MPRLVVIEDQAAVRLCLRSRLESEGMVVLADCDTAATGWAAIQADLPDCVIANIGLPDSDGIALTRQIKEHYPQVAVIILTNHDQDAMVLAALAAGADAYCCKDTDLELVVMAVRRVCEGQGWIDPAIAKVVLKELRQRPSFEDADTELPVSPLTERELEVLTKIVAGANNTQIAEDLQIAIGTVKTHVRSILAKLCVDDRTQAAVRALRAGLVR
ncbi:MAG: response regulator transcription factor [Synechococcaceae cyanobacterium SM2_3_60]|nr:response regulator transcription factor [Synechococcaceae cyanobacterium SM2_3_60]